jgi:hypothetical protein
MNKQNQDDKPNALGRNRLKLTNILTDSDNFQFRKHGLDPAHLKELTGLVERGVTLDPITVWMNPDEKQYFVLAGHHRREAYRRAKKVSVLSVKVFKGSFDEAQAYALKSNTKNQIPMTTEERQNGAWRRVCQWTEKHEYPLSIAETAKSAGISTSQVSNMRKVRSKLHDEGEPIPKNWWQALGKMQDDDDLVDEDERLQAQFAKLDAAIGSEITKAGRMCPAALGKVLACRLGADYHTVISFAAVDADYDESDDEYPF